MEKVPKGTRDSLPDDERLRQALIQDCEKQFLLYDARRMDTPSFELYSTLMEKYNNDENAKEIYVLENKNENGEKCALRYDLTVPFSRYVKTNRIKKMRRYQIGKVYRRDNPSPGRYREFYQCDYDCLGDNIEWATDAETLLLLKNTLDIFRDKYGLPKYTIFINSREILSEMLEKCEIPKELFSTVCTSIDKLDKCDWSFVERELEQKGLNSENIFRLKTIIEQQNLDFLQEATRDKILKVLDIVGKDVACLDLKIARGLDYYTGIIFEVKLSQSELKLSDVESSVSIAGGGRYDKLCSIPCVGFSIGIDRVLNYVSYNFENPKQVWIVRMKSKEPEKLFMYSFDILTKLRNNGISAGTEMKQCSSNNSISNALKANIPIIIFLGDDELNSGKVTIEIKKEGKITQTFEEILTLINK